MKAASLKDLKSALEELNPLELKLIIHRLARLKMENKELLSYLLFDASDERGYVEEIKLYIDEEFVKINPTHTYFAKKTIRKILRRVKRISSYSDDPLTRIETLIYFLERLKSLTPHIRSSHAMQKIWFAQKSAIEHALSKMHPDLQFDYHKRLKEF